MVSLSRYSSIKKTQNRKAFTMIELIFAIVLIGVALLTVPLMIQVNNKAHEGSIAQEAIFLVSSVLSTTTTLVWDNRSIVTTGTADDYVLSKILDISGGTAVYVRTDENGTADNDSNLRAGGLRQDKHRQFFDYNGSLITPAQTGTVTLSETLSNSAASISGFKQAYSIVATRSYVNDTGSFSTVPSSISNLKMTEISIVGEDGVTIAKLRAYTANIGEVDFARRNF